MLQLLLVYVGTDSSHQKKITKPLGLTVFLRALASLLLVIAKNKYETATVQGALSVMNPQDAFYSKR